MVFAGGVTFRRGAGQLGGGLARLSPWEVVASMAGQKPEFAETPTQWRAAFEEVELLDVLQMLNQGRRSVCLRVGDAGWVQFAQGEITHAETPSATGLAAFEALLEAEGGALRVTAPVEDAPVSLDLPFSNLLLDTLTRLDERRAGRGDPGPPLASSLTPPARAALSTPPPARVPAEASAPLAAVRRRRGARTPAMGTEATRLPTAAAGAPPTSAQPAAPPSAGVDPLAEADDWTDLNPSPAPAAAPAPAVAPMPAVAPKPGPRRTRSAAQAPAQQAAPAEPPPAAPDPGSSLEIVDTAQTPGPAEHGHYKEPTTIPMARFDLVEVDTTELDAKRSARLTWLLVVLVAVGATAAAILTR